MSKPFVADYLTTMMLAERMLYRGLINKNEFRRFEEKERVKYGLEKSSIYRNHLLLCVPRRASITDKQEVTPHEASNENP